MKKCRLVLGQGLSTWAEIGACGIQVGVELNELLFLGNLLKTSCQFSQKILVVPKRNTGGHCPLH